MCEMHGHLASKGWWDDLPRANAISIPGLMSHQPVFPPSLAPSTRPVEIMQRKIPFCKFFPLIFRPTSPPDRQNNFTFLSGPIYLACISFARESLIRERGINEFRELIKAEDCGMYTCSKVVQF